MPYVGTQAQCLADIRVLWLHTLYARGSHLCVLQGDLERLTRPYKVFSLQSSSYLKATWTMYNILTRLFILLKTEKKNSQLQTETRIFSNAQRQL